MEMLLPIAGKKAAATKAAREMKIRTLSYDRIVDSLRKKGLTKTAAKG